MLDVLNMRIHLFLLFLHLGLHFLKEGVLADASRGDAGSRLMIDDSDGSFSTLGDAAPFHITLRLVVKAIATPRTNLLRGCSQLLKRATTSTIGIYGGLRAGGIFMAKFIMNSRWDLRSILIVVQVPPNVFFL